MTQDSLKELFVEQIRDIYDAEKQLVQAIPKLAKEADSKELAEALRKHLNETQGQVTRLEEIFEMVGEKAKGKSCKGMKGLIEEGGEATEAEEGVMRDLAIIAGAQRLEHYEISAYGTARTIAEQLGLKRVVSLLQETEDEEIRADAGLSKLAMKLYEAQTWEEEEEPVGASSSRGKAASKRGR